jgi:hypothetical protein
MTNQQGDLLYNQITTETDTIKRTALIESMFNLLAEEQEQDNIEANTAATQAAS